MLIEINQSISFVNSIVVQKCVLNNHFSFKMPTSGFVPNESIFEEEQIRSIRELNEEIEDGQSDVLVFNDEVYYPLINIDPKSIILPSVINISTDKIFIEKECSIYKKAFNKWQSKGFYFALEILSGISYRKGEDPLINLIVKNFAFYVLLFWNMVMAMYAYFYPYSLLSSDELAREFSQVHDFSGVIRCINWHPKQHKVALALVNDNVYIYSSNLLTPLLKHPVQKKVTGLCWNTRNENILAVACEKVIILWNVDPEEKTPRLPLTYAEVIKTNLVAPITCIQFDNTGDWLTVCSPNSSRLLLLNRKDKKDTKGKNNVSGTQPNFVVEKKIDQFSKFLSQPNVMLTANSNGQQHQQQQQSQPSIDDLDKSVRLFGAGVTKFVYSPDYSRVCVGSTRFGIRVYETMTWTYRRWAKEMGAIFQVGCWSQPNGRIFLFSLKNKPVVYAIIFYDKALPNDVGGTSSCIRVLDVSEAQIARGKVGGAIQDMRWDQNAERLVIMFKDNPAYIAVYKTITKPNLEISPIGFIHGLPNEIPLCIDFHLAFKSGSLLTVCWDSGYVSHIPLQYTPNSKKSKSTLAAEQQPSSPRSLTSFCMSSPANEQSFHWASPENSFSKSMTKRFRNQDSILSPRRPVLFSSFSEDKKDS